MLNINDFGQNVQTDINNKQKLSYNIEPTIKHNVIFLEYFYIYIQFLFMAAKECRVYSWCNDDSIWILLHA